LVAAAPPASVPVAALEVRGGAAAAAAVKHPHPLPNAANGSSLTSKSWGVDAIRYSGCITLIHCVR
jgi:hypothetical protein